MLLWTRRSPTRTDQVIDLLGPRHSRDCRFSRRCTRFAARVVAQLVRFQAWRMSRACLVPAKVRQTAALGLVQIAAARLARLNRSREVLLEGDAGSDEPDAE